jgi:hypothetical protein
VRGNGGSSIRSRNQSSPSSASPSRDHRHAGLGGIHFEQGDLDARATGRSCADAAWTLAHARRVIDAPKRSLCLKSLRISAPAALKLLWPEEYSGKGGVGKVVGW